MTEYYLAIDIGASSGRHMLGYMENGKMKYTEIYRFLNGNVEKDGELVWDVDALFREVLEGMKKCKELGKVPVSVGIDTWAVDFVLLDENGKRIGNAVGYRDNATDGMDAEVYKIISQEDLYARTGIQKQMFNTIYQLMAWKKKKKELFEKAETMLLIPDYFHYLLSGVKATEYTNATTTQLVSPKTKEWDKELIDDLGYPQKLFQSIVLPGTCLGSLTEEIRKTVGFDCKVVIPATHDTASAVMSIPIKKSDEVQKVLYISSGTWSLMGTELTEANCTPESMYCNLTNEGGYDYRFRYLKNIMGLWMIQSVKKEIGQEYSFAEICEMAEKETVDSLVDANDARFLAPKSMWREVQRACEESGQEVPKTLGETARVIYRSLARCYRKAMQEIEVLTGEKFCEIHIVGGGSNASYLNRLTAEETGLTVYAGPAEATAIGNIAAQMIAGGTLNSLSDARNCIFNSFDIKQEQD